MNTTTVKKKNGPLYTPEEIEFLQKNYSDKGLGFCAGHLKRSKCSIYNKCFSLGIKVTRNWRAETNSKKIGNRPLHKYKVHPTQFMEIKTPLCAYILGAIWADGHVRPPHDVSLTSTFPDADYMISLWMKTGEWRVYRRPGTQPNSKESCCIITTNRVLCDFLFKNNYVTKSIASACKILSLIPDHLKHYWFRGLFDGDGWCTVKTVGVGIASSFNQDWTYMQKLCEQLKIEYAIERKEKQGKATFGRSSKFLIYGKRKSMVFLDYIYQGYDEDRIGLTRKHDKYLKIKEKCEKVKYTGVTINKHKRWNASTSTAHGHKHEFIGSADTREGALEIVRKYYETHPKNYLYDYVPPKSIGTEASSNL